MAISLNSFSFFQSTVNWSHDLFSAFRAENRKNIQIWQICLTQGFSTITFLFHGVILFGKWESRDRFRPPQHHLGGNISTLLSFSRLGNYWKTWKLSCQNLLWTTNLTKYNKILFLCRSTFRHETRPFQT